MGSGGLMIYGASGHGKVIVDILKSRKKTILGFIDDDPAKEGKEFFGYPIISFRDFKERRSRKVRLIIGIGDNLLRKRVFTRMREEEWVKFGTAVHSSAIVARSVGIGLGTVVMAGVVINCDSRIGKNAIINTSVSIDHDCEIGDFVHISPGSRLGGGVKIGEGSWIGIGASVINNCRIGRNVVVGMGSVIIKDVPDSCVVVGNPARFLKTNEMKG
jgi:sugar O-acyltransferase (sialic acid O-acetyltransferase NeuD family)